MIRIVVCTNSYYRMFVWTRLSHKTSRARHRQEHVQVHDTHRKCTTAVHGHLHGYVLCCWVLHERTRCDRRATREKTRSMHQYVIAQHHEYCGRPGLRLLTRARNVNTDMHMRPCFRMRRSLRGELASVGCLPYTFTELAAPRRVRV